MQQFPIRKLHLHLVMCHRQTDVQRLELVRRNRIASTHFGDVEAIQQATTAELKRIPEEAFRNSIEGWKKRMEKCVRLNGEYFEGESL